MFNFLQLLSVAAGLLPVAPLHADKTCSWVFALTSTVTFGLVHLYFFMCYHSPFAEYLYGLIDCLSRKILLEFIHGWNLVLGGVVRYSEKLYFVGEGE